jgi:hypothetical protein
VTADFKEGSISLDAPDIKGWETIKYFDEKLKQEGFNWFPTFLMHK